MDSFGAAGLAGTAGHNIDRPFVGPGTDCPFMVSPSRFLTAIAGILNKSGREVRCSPVVAADQRGSFIGMAMPAEHRAHSSISEHREDILAHLAAARFAILVV